MDVDAVSFPSHLLGMLTAISEADFVSIDFELSGIATRVRGGPRTRYHKQTIEERYAEVKASAEKYHILQVGITCAKFDYINDKYVLRPYNVHISPLIDERLDIEREFAFQGGAVQFLLKNGFDIAAPFTRGVQYLSREEAERAKQMTYDRLDKKVHAEGLQLQPEEVESLEFVRKTREAIIAWKDTDRSSLEISSTVGALKQPLVPAITNFEKRLVHQLVRAEFPSLVTISRPGFIRIIHYDEVREADMVRKQKQWVKERIVKQSGFRWVVEGLAKGDLHQFDPYFFAKNASGLVIAADIDNIRERFRRATTRLKDHQPVLVGHNMFTDLVNFYHCFFGPLPDTLQEFRELVHQLFPKIVDTKYLATFGCGDINPSASLEDVANELKEQSLPNITIHGDHSKYTDNETLHEAGYDSLLTATIMLRLSAKLNAKNAPPPASGPSIVASSPASTTTMPSSYAARVISTKKKNKNKNRKKKKKSEQNSEPINTKFASHNKFAFLSEDPKDTSSPRSDGNPRLSENTVFIDGNKDWENEPFIQDTTGWVNVPPVERKPMEMMPELSSSSEFWQTYGNTLRVFGTLESVIKIADWE
ncbi:CAF1-domain-containing protein [Lindgomyces ingoldianus]|uniref:CAF1-domain-containing protein n=1 Tax=Lindgomyces ingoldianus TaxID=673940 RepID=A0ACB6RGB5_9PLEO|nr:CAF1-domain-containing protein [Lindgomyces ingoldianus]KAF2477352.1 CAF1-domain-containing protein [Lindgomyces ingoldianus]